jgi:hypothetical protein
MRGVPWDLATMPSLEERFWSRVWQCTHRHPCKKCCWPWRDEALTNISWHTWLHHPSFSDPRLPFSRSMSTGRVAYFLEHGVWLFPELLACHQCDFGPCCNYTHICLGTYSDNTKDRCERGTKGEYQRTVYLPDGRALPASTICQVYHARKDLRWRSMLK